MTNLHADAVFRGGPMNGVRVPVRVDENGVPSEYKLRFVGDIVDLNDKAQDCVFRFAWYFPAMVAVDLWEMHLDREFSWERQS